MEGSSANLEISLLTPVAFTLYSHISKNRRNPARGATSESLEEQNTVFRTYNMANGGVEVVGL